MKTETQDFQLVVLSGPVCAGKTTLALLMRERFGFAIVRTRHSLERRLGASATRSHRRALQRLGNELDTETRGGWVVQAVDEERAARDVDIVVDAVRTSDQISALRALGQVTHIHVTASEDDLRSRYAAMRAREPMTEFDSYEDARNDLTEASVRSLEEVADLVVDTTGGEAPPEEFYRAFTEKRGLR